MRVISQDETLNLPYESVIIQRESNKIYAESIYNGVTYLIGEYSTVEEAKKVFTNIAE